MLVTVNGTRYDIADENVLTITFCICPNIPEAAPVVAAKYYDSTDRRYHTTVNPSRVIDGPLSDDNIPLSGDLGAEWQLFISDCCDLITAFGFTVLDRDPQPQSPKSHYFIVYGMNDNPFGLLVFDLRISDHSNSDITFPISSMQDAYNKLISLNIIDNTISLSDIEFVVEGVLVGSVKHDTWDRAYNRLYSCLQKMKRSVVTHKKVYEEFKLSYLPVAVTSDGQQLTLASHLVSYSAGLNQFSVWETQGHQLVKKCIKIYEGKSLRQVDMIE